MNPVGFISVLPGASSENASSLLSDAEAEAGRLGGDGDRLHAGEQLQHPQIRLPLHPAGSPRPSGHCHHKKQ